MSVRIGAGVIVCSLAASAACAQDFLSVPVVVTSDPAVFADLFGRARREPLHAAMIGDSQETCALGRGIEYMPAFNAEWAGRYGVSPRTPLVQPGQNFGVSYPPAEWLTAGQMIWPFIGDPSPNTTPVALPGLANWPLPVPTGGQRGWTAVLQPRASGVAVSSIDKSRRWIDTSAGVYLDVYALRTGGNILAKLSVSPDPLPAPSATILGQAVTDLQNTDPATGPVARCRIGPITWQPTGEDSCLQVEFVGADAGLPARIVSVSFASVAAPVGLAVTDIAYGGYNSGSLLTNHGPSLDHFTALGLDCAFISLGANDATGFSPATFKQNLTALITALRARCGQQLPVVILGDPLSLLWDQQSLTRAEYYPRVCAELATELSRVCAVNSRRLTHQAGWTSQGGYRYLYDGVHYNETGATLKARLEVQTLWDSFVCTPDIGVQGGVPGRDGQLDNNDFIVFIEAFFTAHPLADVGSQGGVPGSDGVLDNNDFIVFIDDYFAGCGG